MTATAKTAKAINLIICTAHVFRRDCLEAWIVAASGSANFDLNQCGNVALPVPYPPHQTALVCFSSSRGPSSTSVPFNFFAALSRCSSGLGSAIKGCPIPKCSNRSSLPDSTGASRHRKVLMVGNTVNVSQRRMDVAGACFILPRVSASLVLPGAAAALSSLILAIQYLSRHDDAR